jgi:hypothetical protein
MKIYHLATLIYTAALPLCFTAPSRQGSAKDANKILKQATNVS